MHARIALGFHSIVMLASMSLVAGGNELVVESELLPDADKRPTHRYLTVFLGESVYDFSGSDDDEICVLQWPQIEFTLLDPRRELQTSVSAKDVLQWNAHQQTAGKHLPEAVRFAANPDYSPKIASSGLKIQLEHPLLSYECLGERPADEWVVTRYREFADWYARLNAVSRGGLPPEARLQLNKEIAQRGLVPREITRWIDLGKDPKQVLRTRHYYRMELTESDRRRVAQAIALRSTARMVDFLQYRKEEE